LPTADAVGCTLTPLRGYGLIVLFCRVVEILVLTHTESAVPPQNQVSRQPARLFVRFIQDSLWHSNLS